MILWKIKYSFHLSYFIHFSIQVPRRNKFWSDYWVNGFNLWGSSSCCVMFWVLTWYLMLFFMFPQLFTIVRIYTFLFVSFPHRIIPKKLMCNERYIVFWISFLEHKSNFFFMLWYYFFLVFVSWVCLFTRPKSVWGCRFRFTLEEVIGDWVHWCLVHDGLSS